MPSDPTIDVRWFQVPLCGYILPSKSLVSKTIHLSRCNRLNRQLSIFCCQRLAYGP
ncbi:hypothetical protein HanIR_Chr11g0510851 [Helianthus annuus]|nr:hypothetical protein HanIR_Chr11g0510851 [Helianthus annuus]